MLLKPTKYTDVDSSLLAISCEMLKIFRARKVIAYTDLLNQVLSKKGENTRTLFLPALSFLFLLGRVTYHQKKDVIEFKDET